jgi:hypothetical protein
MVTGCPNIGEHVKPIFPMELILVYYLPVSIRREKRIRWLGTWAPLYSGNELTFFPNSSQKFIDLLANCSRYLIELSDYDMCLKLVHSAQLACGDNTDTLAYATLCNVAGSAYYELNKLADCRKNWEVSAQIQEKLLGENDLDVRFSRTSLCTPLFAFCRHY